ncbi:hypothetical protein [Sphingobacterium paucimobilis]|uniref:ACP phosphodiesterase n=1 Tax=Sphingobacterium paucimobilis HER1398 TaxID=1346330 RepID=U2HGU5_9SPHI|nr:hypothetical protein [Sphingobacterium paucimobilis]ERJ60976.1 hypothetical protein M472_19670 [Sphingobacterium paucimobilis HER1398]
MNFLSHYYFERYAIEPEQVLGGLLPDLLKNVDKKYSFQIHKYDDILNTTPKAHAITEGWRRHVEVDRLFHNSEFFYKHTHQLRLAIEKDIVDLPIRASFLAHIGLELLLDHELIAHDLLNVGRLYDHLAHVDRKDVSSYLQHLGRIDTTLFFDFYDRFLASRYIFDYAKVENLPHALFNICRRIWKFEVTEWHVRRLGESLEEYRETQLQGFFDIYSYLSQQLE